MTAMSDQRYTGAAEPAGALGVLCDKEAIMQNLSSIQAFLSTPRNRQGARVVHVDTKSLSSGDALNQLHDEVLRRYKTP